MKSDEFRKHAHEFVDWMADYMDSVESYPVKSQVQPKEIYHQIPEEMPEKGEAMDAIFSDFKKIILKGITHWQHPSFYAYFQANTSPPSILAEMLMATLGVQGMKWDTSPASTELEERMMEWLRDAMALPKKWSGVIQDTATNATLTSILTAREQKTAYTINKNGFKDQPVYRVYCSTETHSSIEKAAKIAGIGKNNVVKIETDALLTLRTDILEKKIQEDLKNGFVPLCIVAALGTTGTLAMDPVNAMAKIAENYHIWLHIDAAYAGSVLLLPEYQHLIKGIEKADTFVFNAHKWLFTNFDCSIYFVKDAKALVNTFAILPEYLKTTSDGFVNNHCDWGIPLGRRFRSLKLWFVMRFYGLKGLQEKLRSHIELTKWMETQLKKHPDFELVVPRSINLLCFHYKPNGLDTLDKTNKLTEQLMQALNATGKAYFTHTKVNDIYTIRMSIGQTHVSKAHVESTWKLIQHTSKSLSLENLR